MYNCAFQHRAGKLGLTTGKRVSPAAHLQSSQGGLDQGAWLQLFQPAALTATSKQGTQNKVGDTEIDPFTGRAQLSSGSYQCRQERQQGPARGTVAEGQQQAFVFLCNWKKEAFYSLFSPLSTLYICTLYCTLYTSQSHTSSCSAQFHSSETQSCSRKTSCPFKTS